MTTNVSDDEFENISNANHYKMSQKIEKVCIPH